MDPLKALEEKVDAIEARVMLAVEIKIIRESVRWELSRLLTLDTDPKKQADYQAALAAIGEQI